MAKVYLETSFVSACVTNRTSLRSRYEQTASILWWNDERKLHESFISDEVLLELSRPTYPRRDEAIEFIRTVPVIPITQQMVEFAAEMVRRMVMPQPVGGDALHVAIAAVAGIEYLLTWNVRHLANPNKVLHLNAVCAEHGYLAPKILRPDDMTELKR